MYTTRTTLSYDYSYCVQRDMVTHTINIADTHTVHIYIIHVLLMDGYMLWERACTRGARCNHKPVGLKFERRHNLRMWCTQLCTVTHKKCPTHNTVVLVVTTTRATTNEWEAIWHKSDLLVCTTSGSLLQTTTLKDDEKLLPIQLCMYVCTYNGCLIRKQEEETARRHYAHVCTSSCTQDAIKPYHSAQECTYVLPDVITLCPAHWWWWPSSSFYT